MFSEEPIINDKTQMIALLQSILSHSGPEVGASVDDEALALLAEGGVDALPREQRDQLLAQVAANPKAALMLQQLCELRSEVSSPATTRITILHFTKRVWTVAACLMVGLFISRMTLPTPTPSSVAPVSPPGRVTPYLSPDQPDYWDQVDQKRLQNNHHWYQHRDMALVISTGTCAVLSIGILVLSLRRKPLS